jgi:hypothetical protein
MCAPLDRRNSIERAICPEPEMNVLNNFRGTVHVQTVQNKPLKCHTGGGQRTDKVFPYGCLTHPTPHRTRRLSKFGGVGTQTEVRHLGLEICILKLIPRAPHTSGSQGIVHYLSQWSLDFRISQIGSSKRNRDPF